jgi:hypothetical protein
MTSMSRYALAGLLLALPMGPAPFRTFASETVKDTGMQVPKPYVTFGWEDFLEWTRVRGLEPRVESPRRIQPFSPLKDFETEQMISSSLVIPQSNLSRHLWPDASIYKGSRLPLKSNGQSHATRPIAQHA